MVLIRNHRAFTFVDVFVFVRYNQFDKLEFVKRRVGIMKSKKSFTITTIVQAIYLLCMILNFLCIRMFTIGVPYTFPFAIIGHVLIFFIPVEFLCLISNLIFLIVDKKQHACQQTIVKVVYICAVFAFFCLIKIILYYYANNLAGVV